MTRLTTKIQKIGQKAQEKAKNDRIRTNHTVSGASYTNHNMSYDIGATEHPPSSED